LAHPSIFSTFIRKSLFLICLLYALPVIAFVCARVFVGELLWWVGLLDSFLPYVLIPALILFALALLARAWRALLLVTPLAVGTVIGFGGLFIPHPPPPITPAWTLRVITINISDSRLPFAQVEAWLLDHPADLIILQESRYSLYEHFPALAAAYPYVVEQQLGNAIAFVSRYPLMPSEGFAEVERGFTYSPRVLMDVNGEQIAIYGMSLPAPLRLMGRIPLENTRVPVINMLWDMFFGYDSDHRDWELNHLLRRIEVDTLPVIAAGDMNLAEFSAARRRMDALLDDSFREVGSGFGYTYPAFEAFGLPEWLPGLTRVDYVWHSDDFVALDARVGEYVGSDHLPVVVTLARR